MHERFIVNVRVPPGALGAALPAALKPQVVNDWGVVSFCVLDLRRLTIAPLPAVAGLRSMSCAVRFAVLDEAGSACVFVPARQTSSRLGARFTRLGFSAPHDLVEIDRAPHEEGGTELAVTGGGETAFDTWLRPRATMQSGVFDGIDDFASFLAAGQRSYGNSRHAGRLTVVDLHKADAGYEPLSIERAGGTFIERWQAVGGEIDSAFRTENARYEWKYYGLIPDGGRGIHDT